MCGFEVWLVLLPFHCQPEDDTGAGGARDQEDHRDCWIKPILKLLAVWVNGCPIVPTSLHEDFCSKSKSKPGDSPVPAFLQHLAADTALLPNLFTIWQEGLAFCHHGTSTQQSQCPSGGGLSHCLSEGLILP